MPSIYGKLFKRRETEARSPLEDFLTEALADVLSRAPREEIASFVSTHLLPATEEAKRAWDEFNAGAKAKRLRWTTQRPTKDGKYVDLLLEAEGNDDTGSWRKLLVVENKVMSGLSRQSVEQADGSPALDQLAVYGRWLKAEVTGDPPGWEGAIALLTHACTAPVGFGRDRATYGVPWQRTCAWHQVWRWLSNMGTAASGSDAPAWRVLAKELADFIMENGMASETMTARDLAVAEVYAPSADRLRASFRRVRARLRAFTKEVANRQSPSGAEFDASMGIIWDWGYLAPPYVSSLEDRWFVAWGIRFPAIATCWTSANPTLPGTVHAFVVLERDMGVGLSQLLEWGDRPAGWSRTGEGSLVAARPMHELGSSTPDEMTEAWGEWVAARTDELIPQLESITRAGPRSVPGLDGVAGSGPHP